MALVLDVRTIQCRWNIRPYCVHEKTISQTTSQETPFTAGVIIAGDEYPNGYGLRGSIDYGASYSIHVNVINELDAGHVLQSKQLPGGQNHRDDFHLVQMAYLSWHFDVVAGHSHARALLHQECYTRCGSFRISLWVSDARVYRSLLQFHTIELLDAKYPRWLSGAGVHRWHVDASYQLECNHTYQWIITGPTRRQWSVADYRKSTPDVTHPQWWQSDVDEYDSRQKQR